MTKAVHLGNLWRQYGRKVVISITPPIITACVRKIRDRFLQRCTRLSPLPHPSEYSTLDNPLEVPCQVEAYLLCRDKYLKPTDVVLDVGFGLGYGLQIMAARVEHLIGLEVDLRAVERARRILEGHPRIKKIMLYDGKHFPFKDKTFDVVTCIEIIEHVKDYKDLLLEMVRVSRRLIFISTPNRRPENTLPDGRPKNYWHLREWTMQELNTILSGFGFKVEWNFLNGLFEGPFTVTEKLVEKTWSLIPVILVGS